MRLWCSVVLLGRYSFTAIPPKVTSYSARSLREHEVILRVYEVVFGKYHFEISLNRASIKISLWSEGVLEILDRRARLASQNAAPLVARGG